MHSAYIKDVFTQIRTSLNRFVAILAIVALGVGFIAGLKATAPTMEHSADVYFDESNFMDIYMLSTLGFTDGDVSALTQQQNIEKVYAEKSIDALFLRESGTEPIKIMAYSEKDSLNRPAVVEGRLPSAANECAVDSRMIYDTTTIIGATLSMSDENGNEIFDSLSERKFTIVGIVDTPQYLSFERGSTKIGNGKLSGYIYVPQSVFSTDYYTALYATVSGASALDSYSDEYDSKIDEAVDALEPFADLRAQKRYDDIKSEAQSEIDDAKAELDEQRNEAEEKLADAESQLTDAKKKLENGTAELNKKKAELEAAKKELAKQQADYETTIKEKTAELETAQRQYDTNLSDYNEKSVQLVKSLAQLNELSAAAELLAAAGKNDEAAALILQYNEGMKQYNDAIRQLAFFKTQLDDANKKLEAGYAALEQGKSDATQKFADAQAKTDDGEKQISNAQKELDDGKNTYAQSEAEYISQKAEADTKIADADAKIADAEAELEKLGVPDWYVLDRRTNVSYVSFLQDTQKVDAIAAVFPLFFFMVAALVCLTTMTRMVEEQRTQIGIYKSLGYSKGAIAFKYLLYANSASLIGCAIGLLGGLFLFPTVIMQAYKIMYNMPVLKLMPDLFTTIAAPVVSLLCISGATLWACLGALRSVPADLIRPKSPPKGKRIFLEKIGFIWKRFSFSQKVSARNIVRYKKRFFMTVIGIIGCTALMLTGFGLYDSINGIIGKQFDEIFNYDMSITLKQSDSELEKTFANSFDRYALLQASDVDVLGSDLTVSSSLVVAENVDAVSSLVTFRNRTTKSPVVFNENTVLITEKLASKLSLSVGDSFRIKYDDTTYFSVTVGGVCENYVHNYIYMPSSVFENASGLTPQFKTVWGEYDESTVQEDELASELLKNENITAVNLFSDTRSTFSDVLKGLNAIVYLVIISAGCLAFVVLYNLTNITITERIREIATIKVLGFTDGEVAMYVFRENAVLTLIGTLLGLVAGVFLHSFVVVTAEVEIVMFCREIEPLSYLYAVLATLVFAAAVNFVMFFKLRSVGMVESLKSVE